jgi:ADP-ribosylglycohydrolase
MNTLKQKLINGLYGLADAVGNPFEFKSNIKPNDVVAYANLADRLFLDK